MIYVCMCMYELQVAKHKSGGIDSTLAIFIDLLVYNSINEVFRVACVV